MAAADAGAWDDRADEMRSWPDERLESARRDIHALVGRLERLRTEAELVAADDRAWVSKTAIALRQATTAIVWIGYVLHERRPATYPSSGDQRPGE